MSGTHETILAFDYGLRRIGVAVGQKVTNTANPLGTVGNGESGPAWPDIRKLIQEWRPDRIVVGMPANADGSRADFASHVEEFVRGLATFELPVETVDERYSSLEAEELLRDARAGGRIGRISKDMIDSAAAALIAERYLSGI